MHESEIILFRNRAEAVRNSRYDTIVNNLRLFFQSVSENPELLSLYKSIVSGGLPDYRIFEQVIKRSRQLSFPDDYLDKIRVCLAFVEAVCETKLNAWDLATEFSDSESMDVLTREFLSEFFEPVFTYFVERLVIMDNFLHILVRFKVHVEWFQKRGYYAGYSSDTKRGEAFLDGKLREFLFSSGIDYPFSTPASPEGRTDILHIIKEKPIPIEVKLYNGDMSYIRQGFRQAILYAQNYNSPHGYYVIFNVTDNEISFSNDVNKPINHGGKSIYVIIVYLYPHNTSASKRQMKTVELTEKYLISQ